jgi:hypothetical protein
MKGKRYTTEEKIRILRERDATEKGTAGHANHPLGGNARRIHFYVHSFTVAGRDLLVGR